MYRNLFFYFLFLFFSGHAFGQKNLLGVELGMVATKPNNSGPRNFEVGLGPSLNLNYTKKFKKALWVSAGLTAKTLTYNSTLRVFFPSDINNPDGTVLAQQIKHSTVGTTVLTGIQLPGTLQRFSPFIGVGSSIILHSTSRTTKRSGSGSAVRLPHGGYDGPFTEFTGGLQYSHPIGKRFFLTTSVRYVYAPADVEDNSNVFPAAYNFSHLAAHISLQRAIRL